jgi:hypothetical protein
MDLSESYREQMNNEADRERLIRISQQSADDKGPTAIFWLYLAELLVAAGAVVILRG